MGSPVFANSMEISSKSMDGKSICQFPDVCFTPPQTPATPPGVPVPYPNTGMASDTSDGSRSTTIASEEIMLKDKSAFKQSTGDEAGCAPKKGIINSKIQGKVYFIAWSMDVMVEGENVVRHLDMTTHNHASSPANGSVPITHVAAMALNRFAKCGHEAQNVEHKCNRDPACPGILNWPIKTGPSSAVAKMKDVFKNTVPRPLGTRPQTPLSDAEIADKKLLVRHAKASQTVAEKKKDGGCVRAMRCYLRPYDADRDGVNGCCPGQTPHHIPPWDTFSSVSGNTISHGDALCVCLEGAGHSIGSHGKHHHGINYLLEQAAASGTFKTATNPKNNILYKGPLSEHVKIAAAVTEAQCGCSKECIEEQLKQQFGATQLRAQATHNASTTGGTAYGLLDATSQANAITAMLRPPPAPPIP